MKENNNEHTEAKKDKKVFEFVKKIDSRKFILGMRWKLVVVFAFIVVLLVYLGGVMTNINRTSKDLYTQKVFDNLKYKNNTILAKRGDITDSTGTILAYSKMVYNLILDPNEYWKDDTDKEKNIDVLVQCFGCDRNELLEIFDSYNGVNSYYKRYIRYLTYEEVQEYKLLKENDSDITASWLEEEYIREYPYSSLAAHVIGYASQSTGVIGIESYYNEYLTGTNGREYGYVGEESSLETNVKPAINGSTIMLTIDGNIQRIVERKLKEFNEEYGSKHTAFILMDPDNGEVLAMAQYPFFDLNNPNDLSAYYSQEEIAAMDNTQTVDALYDIWSNFCVSDIYEPGSVFKAFTIAGGIEEGIIKGDELYLCDGYEEVQGTKIGCAVTEGHGELTVSGALEQSCNDALMQMSYLIGTKTFSKYLGRFNFGSKTGIDLPSEGYGLLYNAETMTAIDLATNSFGQNLNVTMIQQAAAFSSLINGGYYYQPHLVKRIQSASGETLMENEGTVIRNTVSAETSEIMREYLQNVVDYGTGGYLQIEGYTVGGKTGAAEKQPRDKMHYLISFIGFMPAEDPEVVFYVVIDEAEVEDFASSRAAQELARDIMIELIPYLEIYPEDEKYEINIGKEEETEEASSEGEAVSGEAEASDGSESDNTEETAVEGTGENEAVTEEVTEAVTEEVTVEITEAVTEMQTEGMEENPSVEEKQPIEETKAVEETLPAG